MLASCSGGSAMAGHQSRECGELSQRSLIARRVMESRDRAEKAAGVGTVENEAQKSSSDRQSDGRNLSQSRFSSPSSTSSGSVSIDFSGKLGINLDIIG